MNKSFFLSILLTFLFFYSIVYAFSLKDIIPLDIISNLLNLQIESQEKRIHSSGVIVYPSAITSTTTIFATTSTSRTTTTTTRTTTRTTTSTTTPTTTRTTTRTTTTTTTTIVNYLTVDNLLKCFCDKQIQFYTNDGGCWPCEQIEKNFLLQTSPVGPPSQDSWNHFKSAHYHVDNAPCHNLGCNAPCWIWGSPKQCVGGCLGLQSINNYLGCGLIEVQGYHYINCCQESCP